MRTVILCPDANDLTPEGKQFWDNFIWRVRDALDRDHLNARVLVVTEPEEPRNARVT